jgi:hypothetical protein
LSLTGEIDKLYETVDANGNVKFADDGNIRYEYSYEERDLVERVDQFRSCQVPVSFVYKYDDVENLIETDELVNGSLQAITRYQYEDPRYYNTQVTQFGVGLSNKQGKRIDLNTAQADEYFKS